ncbi:MAG: hypothetical protein IKA02_02035 [Clostridia bacterium]|nr:hypothetical protein [Clostridia bacterium]
MKRKVLLFFVAFTLLTCFFALGVFATEIKLETSVLDDIHTSIENAQTGDSITVDLTGDLIIPNTSSAIKLAKDITLTINCNGYTIFAKPGSASAGTVYGMYVNSIGAKLILNGTTEVDYVNYVEPQDAEIKLSNGVLVNPNKETGVKSPDYASNGPAIFLVNGEFELNNMYINQYNTGEWGIFIRHSAGSGVSAVNNVTINNSIVRVHGGNYGAIGTRQGDSNLIESLVRIENSVIYGTSTGDYLSMSANSYIKNSRIEKYALKIDSYMKDSFAREGNEAVLQNVIFNNEKNSLETGTIYLKVIDCQFVNGMNFYVSGDSQGKTRFTLINSPTCEEEGKQGYIECNRGGGKTVTGFNDLTINEEYDGTPLGHSADVTKINGVTYESFLDYGTYSAPCVRCGKSTQYEQSTALPLFNFLGYSTPEDGSYGIVASFTVNLKVIEQYEKMTGKTVNYGMVAVAKDNLGDKNPLDENGNAVTLEKGAVVKAEVSRDYCAYDFVLTGMNENQADIQFVFATYVTVTKDGATEVLYLQGIQKTEKLSRVSYNTILETEE